MIRYPAPDKSAFTSLAICSAAVIIPYAGNLPVWVLAIFSGLLGWKYFIEHHHWKSPGRITLLALMLLLVFLVFRQHGTILGRDAGLSLLVVLIGLKLMELKTLRDYVLSVFLFFLLVLGNFLYSQSILLGIYLLVTIIICVATLVHLNQKNNVSAGYRLRLASGLVIKALPLMIIIYLLFPRLHGGFWGLPGSQSGVSGFSDEMRPGTISRLIQSDAIAFRASFENQAPAQNKLYWRGLILDQTDGRRWQKSSTTHAQESFTPIGEVINYEIMLEPSWQRWLFVLDLPARVPRDAYARKGFTLEAQHSLQTRTSFQLSSYPDYVTHAPSETEKHSALYLPENINERAKQLAATWRNQYNHPADIANAALHYFREQEFHYTLQPPLLGGEPVDEFLFETRRGFCEHYASAFTTLMRAAGIPARVVVGYQGGEYNTAGNYYIVRQQDAHAWSEIWLKDRGWLRVDPTAAVAPERIEHGIDAVRRLQRRGLNFAGLSPPELLQALSPGWMEAITRQMKQRWDSVNVLWYRWVMDFNSERQQQLLDLLGFGSWNWLNKLLAIVGFTLVTIAILAGLLTLRKQKQDKIQKLYAQYCKKLSLINIDKALNEGPLDYAQRVVQKYPSLENAVEPINNLYIALRYGSLKEDNHISILKKRIRGFHPKILIS